MHWNKILIRDQLISLDEWGVQTADLEGTVWLLHGGWGDGGDNSRLGVTPQGILEDSGQLWVSISNVLIAESLKTWTMLINYH